MNLATADRRRLIAVTSVAVVARVIAAGILGDAFHFADETAYVDAADRLLRGAGFGAAYDRVPAFPVLLAVLRMPGSSLLAVRCAHAVLVGMGCLVVFALGRRAFGTAPALIATLVFALDPLHVVASGLLYPEAVASVVVAGVVLLTLRAAETEGWGRDAFAGLLLAVAALLRPVAILLLPAVALWRFFAGPGPARGRALRTAVLCAVFGAGLLPYSLRNSQVEGRFSPVPAAGVKATELHRNGFERVGVVGAMVETVTEDPIGMARQSVWRFAKFWELYPTRLATDDPARRAQMHEADERLPVRSSFPHGMRDRVSALSFGAELLFAIVGVGFAWRRRRRETVLVLSTILSFALGYAVLVSKMRYRIPILPLLYLFTAVGVTGVFRLVRERWFATGGKARP